MMKNDSSEKNFTSTIARMMKEHREKNGLSQRELAELMEMPQSTITRIESGESGINSNTLAKFLKVIGLVVEFKPYDEEGKQKVLDVCNYVILKCKEILNNKGELGDYDVTNMKLNKLLYFIQLESLRKFNKPIVSNYFKAWEHGPVHLTVYHEYKSYQNQPIPQSESVTSMLTKSEKELINSILDKYARKSAYELREITHQQSPWKNTRNKGNNEYIELNEMQKFVAED